MRDLQPLGYPPYPRGVRLHDVHGLQPHVAGHLEAGLDVLAEGYRRGDTLPDLDVSEYVVGDKWLLHPVRSVGLQHSGACYRFRYGPRLVGVQHEPSFRSDQVSNSTDSFVVLVWVFAPDLDLHRVVTLSQPALHLVEELILAQVQVHTAP